MPLYEYQCPNGHSQENVYLKFADAPETITCPNCAQYGEINTQAVRLMGLPNFKLGWNVTINDSGKAWEGTPLEDSDTANKLTYKSKKMFFDNARKTQVGGRSKPKPTRGVAALGQ